MSIGLYVDLLTIVCHTMLVSSLSCAFIGCGILPLIIRDAWRESRDVH